MSKTNKLNDLINVTPETIALAKKYIKLATALYLNSNTFHYHATDDAPNSYRELELWANFNDPLESDSMPVFNGANESTIWNDKDLTIMIRAWHDITHIKEKLTFSYEDELKVSSLQIEVLKSVSAPYWLIQIFRMDFIGQTEYYNLTDEYVTNQAQFVSDCYNTSLDLVLQLVNEGRRY